MTSTRSELRQRLEQLLVQAEAASAQPMAYAFLPDIVANLQALRTKLADPDFGQAQRAKAAGSLGRLVTEDFAFSESALGQALLEFVSDLAPLEGTTT